VDEICPTAQGRKSHIRVDTRIICSTDGKILSIKETQVIFGKTYQKEYIVDGDKLFLIQELTKKEIGRITRPPLLHPQYIYKKIIDENLSSFIYEDLATESDALALSEAKYSVSASDRIVETKNTDTGVNTIIKLDSNGDVVESETRGGAINVTLLYAPTDEPVIKFNELLFGDEKTAEILTIAKVNREFDFAGKYLARKMKFKLIFKDQLNKKFQAVLRSSYNVTSQSTKVFIVEVPISLKKEATTSEIRNMDIYLSQPKYLKFDDDEFIKTTARITKNEKGLIKLRPLRNGLISLSLIKAVVGYYQPLTYLEWNNLPVIAGIMQFY